MSNNAPDRIMNRVKVGDEIKHIDQQTLLDNLDAYASKRGSDRVYVTSPEGKRGSVEMRELKELLNSGYQLIDDTEGYNKRPDIIEKRQSQKGTEAATAQREYPENPVSAADVMAAASGMNDSMFSRTIGAAQNRRGMEQVIGKELQSTVEGATQPAAQALENEVPKLPWQTWQTNLEYAEAVTAAKNREQERYQEQLMQEAKERALPESLNEIDSKIAEIDAQLAQFEGSQERFITSPEGREIAQVFNFNRKRLSNEDKARQTQLMEQRKALDVQRDLFLKFKKYEQYDKDADRTAIGRFFGGMAANGDLQALATFGLTQMTRDLEFLDILAKAEKGIELTNDERKAIQMYQNLQQIQSKDRGAFFSAGSGMQTTFEFMRDMALFGFGGGARAATNQGVKQILKQSLKNFARKSGDIFLKAPLTPSFYRNLTANQVRNFEITPDANGRWDVNKKESSLKNAYRTYAETTTEFASEALGNVFEQIGLLGRIARSTGKGKGIISKMVKSYDRMHNRAMHNKVGKFILGGMQQMGLNNFPTEFLEEIAVIPMQSLLLWENQFGQLADPRFYQEVAISTAALGGMHSAVNLVVGGPTAYIERRKTDKKMQQLRTELEGLRDATDDVNIKSAIDRLYNDVEGRNYYNEDYEFTGENIINDLESLRNVSSDPKVAQAAEDYVQIALFKEGQTEAMRAIAENELGRFEYGTSGGVMLGQTIDGDNVFILDETGKSVTVRVQGYKDAEPFVIPRTDIVSVTPLDMDSFVTDWFVGRRPGEIKLETVEDVQQMDREAEPATSEGPTALSIGDTALYEGMPVRIVDSYDGNVTIEDENGAMHTVRADELQKAPATENATVYILPDGRRAITAGKDRWGNYNLQVIDDNGNFVDTVYATAEELMQYDKLTADQANVIEQVAQDPQAAVEVAAAQEAAEQQEQLPMDKDGNINFDALLVQSPERFLQEFSNVVGEDRAMAQLERTAANIDEQIQQVTGKLEKSTSLNETVKLQNDINNLTRQKESIQAILDQRQETGQETEEVYNRPALGSDTGTDTRGVDSGRIRGATTPAGNSPQTSDNKGKQSSAQMQTPVQQESSVATEPVNPKTILESALDSNAIAALVQQAEQVNTEPTEGQKEAGNYKMGHIKINGFDITIENPKGSIRSGIDNNGIPWEVQMNNHYGYFRRTEGKDGDHIDVFIGDSPTSGKIFIVDQVDNKGNFDEHKVMMGFDSIEEAEQAYLSNYSPGWNGLGNITEVSQEEFKDWVKDGKRKTEPFAARQDKSKGDTLQTAASKPHGGISPQKDILANAPSESKGKQSPDETQSSNQDVVGRSLSENEAKVLIDAMKANAEVAPEVELTPENWLSLFGESGNVSTPIGSVVMGENQYFKIAQQGRNGKLGMVKPTLESPTVIIEDKSNAANGDEERDTSYIFIKTFAKKDGKRYYHFTSVTVSKNGYEVVISNQEKTGNRISKLLQQGKVAWIDTAFSLHPTTQIEESVPLNDSNKPTSTDIQPALLGINSSESSVSKGKQSSAQMQTPVQQESSVVTEPVKKSDRLISEDEYAELRKRMREKLSQLNVGLDPEMLSIGIKMAVYHIENGAYKFTDYTRRMLADLGDAIRPYLKSFYNGVRDLPEAAELSKDMDSYADVAATDVNSIAMEEPVEVTAEEPAGQETIEEPQPVEQEPAQQAPAQAVRGTVTKDIHTKTGADLWVVKLSDRVDRDEFLALKAEAKKNGGSYSKFKKGFIFTSETDANKFNNIDNGQITDTQAEQGSADTIAVNSEAEAVISKIGSQAEAVRTPAEAVARIEECDRVIEKVNDRLALLGYYKADYDDSKFNESYGYAKTAEKKALKDAEKLAHALAKDLGINVGRKKLASANIAPAGGDIIFRLPLKEDRQLYVNIGISPNSYGPYDTNAGSDDLFVRNIDISGRNAIYYRIENIGSSGVNRYGINYFADADVMYNDLLSGIRRIAGDWLPSAQPQPQQDNKPVIELVKPKEESPNPDFKVGDKVLYNGKIATITDIDMGRPVLDTGMAPVMYEFANWSDLSKYEQPKQTNNGKEEVQRLDAGTTAARGNRQPRIEDEALGSSQQPQVLTDEQARVDRDSSTTVGNDNVGSRGLSGRNDQQQHAVEQPDGGKNSRNWRYPASGTGIPTSATARFKANMAAIEVLRQLQESGDQATPEQMETLSRYSGWGGLGNYFNTTQANIAGTDAFKLKALLSKEEYDSAVMSINSAYYTPVEVINTLWDVAAQLGFKGGNILEGSAGTGNILGMMPQAISSNSNIEAVEIDSVSGSILSYLYPDAQVHVQGFEKTNIPNGSVDLAITNVPFVTGLRVNDPIDKDLSNKFNNIHDFCIAKNVRKLRDGGIGIFISSNGTLDKSKKLREWLVSREGNADVIGAFRLNNKTFEGAPVTSDIIVVRKRTDGVPYSGAIDVSGTSTTRVVPVKTGEEYKKSTGEYKDILRDVALDYNRYFQQHPENMGGEMAVAAEKGEEYRATSIGLYPAEGISQNERLQQWIATFSPLEQTAAPSQEQPQVEYEQSSEKEGALVIDKEGNLCISRRGQAVPLDVNSNKIKGRYTKSEALKDYNSIKKALNDVLEYQVNNSSDEGLSPLLKKLGKAYDNFVKKYDQLNKNVKISFLRQDVDFPAVAAIENYSESETIDGKKKVNVSKTDVFKGRVIGYEATPTPTSVKDGIILSVQKRGVIDAEQIAQWLGKDKEQVIEEVISSRMGFINPVNGLLEVRHDYLSGNVREKLSYARANNADGRYNSNIEELEKVVPVDIPAHLIEFSLGSTWIDPKLYSDFAKEKYDVELKYTNMGGIWAADRDVTGYNEKNRSAGVYSDVVHKQVMGHELFMAAMNNTPITISKQRRNYYSGGTETVVDKQASQMCTVRMQEIKEEFKEWARERMKSETELASSLANTYNEKFNAFVPKTIDKTFTPERFEGASGKFKLYPHQKKAVIRATTEPLMLAHEVGTGKTFTLISTAMEMRRLGTAKKPMIVVQNATVGQFVSEAKKLYPNAKVLTVGTNDRTVEGRKEFYAKIKYNDWDIIVVPQSVFERIPDNQQRKRDFVQEKIDEKLYAIEAARDAGVDKQVISQMEKDLKRLEEDFDTATMHRGKSGKGGKKEAIATENAAVMAERQLDRATDEVEDFDAMGIDALLVDEAHEYKHLGFATTMQRGVKGVDPSYSQKAASVYLKTRAVLEKSGGRNVVFATGTPISNTAAEIWTFMRYLMPKDTMVANDIYYFDDFVRNFGNISQNLEFATNGKFKENTRFASYVNLPELVRLWGSVSDTVLTKEVKYVNDKIPDMETGKAIDIFLPQTPGLVDIMNAVRARLEEYEKMSGKEKKANSHIPLTMYGIAKRAAIDPRLINPLAIDEPLSKTNKAVEETLRSLNQTKDYKGTVAIFCDNYRRLEEDPSGKKDKKGNPKKIETFNLFHEIKRKLVASGIPASQIVIMESKMSDARKENVFAAVNAGTVRVILGSTQTLGTGVNIQQRLHTLIHMDAPDRPMDYTQRNGRILRQGNLHKEWNKEVRVLRFGVEDSLDITSYQRLKTKAAFIDSVMDGKPLLANNQENRVLEEDEEGLFDNPVAVLSGSQYALLKSQAERELRKLQSRLKQWEADQIYVSAQLKKNQGQLERNRANKEAYKQALETIQKKFPKGVASAIVIDGTKCTTEEEMIQAYKYVNKKMNERIEKLRNDSFSVSDSMNFTLEFDGMPVEVALELKRESRLDEKNKGVQVSVHRDMKYSIPALNLTDIPVSGGYIKGAVDDIVENVITGEDFNERLDSIERGTKRLQQENELLSAREGKPFEFTSELEDARKKVAEYTDLMKKEMAEKEAKYAQREGTGAAVDIDNIVLDEEPEEDEDNSTVQAQIDQVERVPQLSYSEQMAYDAVRQALSNASIPVVIATDEMVEETLGDKDVRLQAVKNGMESLKKAERFIDNAIKGNTKGSFTIILPEKTLKKIRTVTGSDFNGHSINATSIIHSKNNHGENGRKITANSIPLKDDDFRLLPYIMTAPDVIQAGSTDAAGRTSIRFVKNLSNGIAIVVEKEQKNSPDDMETITMWADLSPEVADARRKTSPAIDVRNVILSTDAAKIVKDAENAIASDIARFSIFGGNRGYVGYSMSKRAAQAREEGRYPKTDFKKEYNVPEKTFAALVNAGIISDREWHHTSKFGNKTTFYSWDDESYLQIYQDNKKAIDNLCKGKGLDGKLFITAVEGNPYEFIDYKVPADYYSFRNTLNGLSSEEVQQALDNKFPEMAAARENNRKWSDEQDRIFREDLNNRAAIRTALERFFEENSNSDLSEDNNGVHFSIASDEKQSIIDAAKAAGIYLKAPNGKDTNLTQEQWVTVRTKAFKNWFGDWEIFFKKNFLLNGTSVTNLSGSEFKKTENKTLTEQVGEYFNSLGGKAISPLYGEVILDETGAEDSLSHGIGRDKAIAYAAVKDVIENGVLLDYDKNHKGRNYDSALIAAPITIRGERYICEVVITRKQDNRFYLHEVTSVKKLQDVVSLTNSGQSPTAHQGVVAKVLQNIISANVNISKVVDANGEPLIVYHGTGSEFYTFDGDFTSQNSELGDGFYFTNNREFAELYTDSEHPDNELKIARRAYDIFLEMGKSNDREDYADVDYNDFMDDNLDGYDTWDDQMQNDYELSMKRASADLFVNPRVIPAFLNIRNPHIAKGNDMYASSAQDGVIDPDMTERYKWITDGGISGPVSQYVVFGPNQIKSADDNTGDFSTDNNDIRFSIDSDIEGVSDETIQQYQERLDNVDSQIRKWQQQGRSIPEVFWQERGKVIKQFLDEIGTVPVSMVTEGSFEGVMKNDGVNTEYIEDVKSVLKEERIPGVFLNGKVYMFSDALADIPEAHETYIHERQHSITHEDFRNNVNEILSRVDSVQELEDIVSSLAGNDNYRGEHRATLADEFISYAMALSYTNANFAGELRKAGANEFLIDYINEYNRSQWQETDLSKARRRQGSYLHERVDERGNAQQDVRDTGEGTPQMGQQRPGSVQGSQTGAGERKYFKSRVGTVRGWTKNGIIYLTKDGLNPDTPIHEYTHIWADAVQKFNPALWNNVKSLMKRLPQWQQVVSDSNYQDIAGNDNAVASEVLARYSGKRGAKRLEQEARAMGESKGLKGSAARLLERAKKAIADFWDWVNVNLFNLSGFSSAEEVADRVLYDLVSGTDLNRPADITESTLEKVGIQQLLGEESYAAMMDDVFAGMDTIQQVHAAQGDRAANTREYITQVCEDVANRGEEAMKIAASVRSAFQDKGINLLFDNVSLLHQMWKECNSLPQLTVKERLESSDRSNKIRFSIEEDMGPVTNDIKLSWQETFKERIIDRMHSVSVLKKVVSTRHGIITDQTDPYMSENLASSRSMYEIEHFKQQMFEPLLNKVVEIQKMFQKKGLVKNAKLTYKAVNDYLYALHAPERNKHICVEEVVTKMMKKISKEELKFFKSSDHTGVLTALVSRMYNEKVNPAAPMTSDMLANNIIKGAAKTKEENDLLNEFRKKFTNLTKTARADINKIFSSKRGNNRSGMTDQEAKEIITKYRRPDTEAALKELSDLVQKCNNFTLDTWLKYSMIDRQTYDNYKGMYQHYIPLRSWADKEDVDYDSLGKQAFNHASEIVNLNRKAAGRSSRADDPIAYIASLAQSAVVVGNKNMVHLNAFRLVQQNKDILEDIAILPQIYYVQVEDSDEVIAYDERPSQELFDKGLVTTKTNKSYRWHKTHSEYEAHTVPVIIDGNRYMIVFKGNIGVKIASALNNTNVNHWAAADALRPLTRWLSAVRTSYSPEFVLVNFVRDFLFGNIAYAIEGGNAAKFNKNLKAAFKTINKIEGNRAAQNSKALKAVFKVVNRGVFKENTSRIDALYEEFRREGGQTGYIHMRKIEQIKKENDIMRRRLAREKTVGDWLFRNGAMRLGKSTMEYLSVMSENAMRFAVFMTEREKGTSAKEAAFKAHEITVNFNRKGTQSGNWNAFYSFFNASVQGTYRLWQLGKNHPKRTAVALSSLALGKLLSAVIAGLIGGDDYDELSDYVKFSNIIIPAGEDENGRTIFITIPMPQGMRAFSNLSDVTVDVLRGNKNVAEGISTWLLNATGEFLPLAVDAIDLTGRESGQSIIAPFVPTAVQPFFDVWSNKDFKGDPIFREDFTKGTEDYTPEWQKVYANANPVYVEVSKALNRLAGGSDELSSAIKVDKNTGDISRRWYGYAFDKNPAAVEHIIDGYLGGMATFTNNIIKTVRAAVDDEVDMELHTLPIAGRFTRQAFYKEGYDTWYEVADRVRDIEAAQKAMLKEQNWDSYARVMGNGLNAHLTGTYNVYNDRVKQLQEVIKSDNLSRQERKQYSKMLDELIAEAAGVLEDIISKYEEN